MEAVAVLALLGVGASISAPTARRVADRAVVVGAREEVVRGLLEARALALASGGATATLLSSPPTVRIETKLGSTTTRALLSDRRVTLVLGTSRDSIAIAFDGLGLGRFASHTIALEHRDARAAVVVSSYGRITRR
jgi:hypothetical protein